MAIISTTPFLLCREACNNVWFIVSSRRLHRTFCRMRNIREVDMVMKCKLNCLTLYSFEQFKNVSYFSMPNWSDCTEACGEYLEYGFSWFSVILSLGNIVLSLTAVSDLRSRSDLQSVLLRAVPTSIFHSRVYLIPYASIHVSSSRAGSVRLPWCLETAM